MLPLHPQVCPDPVVPCRAMLIQCLCCCARRSALILYRQILDRIEANNYDNFTKRAYVPKWQKMVSLPLALARAVAPSAFTSYKP